MADIKPLGNSFPGIPLSLLFRLIINIRNWIYDHFGFISRKANRTVISIGGIHAGGTGKTPLTLFVGNIISQKNIPIAFISRGYKRQNRKNIICKPLESPAWQDVGDEPYLLHANLPYSWLGIGKNRKKTTGMLEQFIPARSVFILDDGFQHRQLKRDLDIVCLPSENLFTDYLLPAGTLREPLTALSRAHVVCIIGAKSEEDSIRGQVALLQKRFSQLHVFACYQEPTVWVNVKTKEEARHPEVKKPIFVCGIARPERFEKTVRSMNITPESIYFFGDHHALTTHDIDVLCKNDCDAILTTEKDACKFATLNLVKCPDIWYLKIEIVFFDTTDSNIFKTIILNTCKLI